MEGGDCIQQQHTICLEPASALSADSKIISIRSKIILTFDSDLILGSLLTFWGPNGLFLGLGWGSKTVLGFTHLVEQLLFSMFPSILAFDFDLILGLF